MKNQVFFLDQRLAPRAFLELAWCSFGLWLGVQIKFDVFPRLDLPRRHLQESS